MAQRGGLRLRSNLRSQLRSGHPGPVRHRQQVPLVAIENVKGVGNKANMSLEAMD